VSLSYFMELFRQFAGLGFSLSVCVLSLLVVPMCMDGELLIFETDVIASIVAFYTTALMVPNVNEKHDLDVHYRCDHAVSLALTTLGFAALNVFIGGAVGDMFPSRFDFASSPRGEHWFAVIAAGFLGIISAHYGASLANEMSEQSFGQTKSRIVDAAWSVLLLCAAAVLFAWYMGATIDQMDSRTWADKGLMFLGCAAGAIAANILWRRTRSQRRPYIVMSGGKPATWIRRHRFKQKEFYSWNSIFDLETPLTLPVNTWTSIGASSHLLHRAHIDEELAKERAGVRFTLFQGVREVVGYNEALVTIHTPLSELHLRDVELIKKYQPQFKMLADGTLKVRVVLENTDIVLVPEIKVPAARGIENFMGRVRVWLRCRSKTKAKLDKESLKDIQVVKDIQECLARLEDLLIKIKKAGLSKRDEIATVYERAFLRLAVPYEDPSDYIAEIDRYSAELGQFIGGEKHSTSADLR